MFKPAYADDTPYDFGDGELGTLYGCICLHCNQYIAWASVPEERMIYPPVRETANLSKYVPPKFHKDFLEAQIVLEASPNASAMLSRRCLQRLIRNHLDLKKANLAEEIDAVAEIKGLPSYLAADLHAVRIIGNFAAHPIKSLQPEEITDIEPGEAAWLVEIIEGLFDFLFVAPRKAKERRKALNEKQIAAGKTTRNRTSNPVSHRRGAVSGQVCNERKWY